MKYVKHFICPYCGKELLNQNEFVECENENEFWCDTCDTTFIIEEDGEVYEEQAFARARRHFAQTNLKNFVSLCAYYHIDFWDKK